MQDVNAELTDVDEEEDEEAEGTVAPETEKAEKKKKKKSGGESENRGGERKPAESSAHAGHLKAPYSGLYQQTNEQGVKSRNQSRARPKSTP